MAQGVRFFASAVASAAFTCKFPCKEELESAAFCRFLRMARKVHHARLRMGASRNHSSNVPTADGRGVRILAKSVYRELRNSGHSRSDIVAFTNAVLELVTSELRDAQEAAE